MHWYMSLQKIFNKREVCFVGPAEPMHTGGDDHPWCTVGAVCDRAVIDRAYSLQDCADSLPHSGADSLPHSASSRRRPTNQPAANIKIAVNGIEVSNPVPRGAAIKETATAHHSRSVPRYCCRTLPGHVVTSSHTMNATHTISPKTPCSR